MQTDLDLVTRVCLVARTPRSHTPTLGQQITHLSDDVYVEDADDDEGQARVEHDVHPRPDLVDQQLVVGAARACVDLLTLQTQHHASCRLCSIPCNLSAVQGRRLVLGPSPLFQFRVVFHESEPAGKKPGLTEPGMNYPPEQGVFGFNL